jgi:CspA family cold shock protein
MREKFPQSPQVYVAQEEQTAPELFEISGCVKWFDPSKGYGFIVPDDDLPDVLLHLSCLREGGFKVVREGARVVCEGVEDPEGLAGVQDPLSGRFHLNQSIAATATHPCRGCPGERLAKGCGEVV